MKKSLIVGLLTSVIFLSFASIVFAVETKLPGDVVALPEIDKTGFFKLFTNAANIIFTALLILASVFILLAAFQFITGGGDPEAMGQARSKLIWAAVGIGVALVARGLPGIIQNILQGAPAT